MNIFLIKAKEWQGYDCAQGYVIRAWTAPQARKLAAGNTGDEPENVWLSKEHSTCDKIGQCFSGDAEVLLCDFHAG